MSGPAKTTNLRATECNRGTNLHTLFPPPGREAVSTCPLLLSTTSARLGQGSALEGTSRELPQGSYHSSTSLSGLSLSGTCLSVADTGLLSSYLPRYPRLGTADKQQVLTVYL